MEPEVKRFIAREALELTAPISHFALGFLFSQSVRLPVWGGLALSVTALTLVCINYWWTSKKIKLRRLRDADKLKSEDEIVKTTSKTIIRHFGILQSLENILQEAYDKGHELQRDDLRVTIGGALACTRAANETQRELMELSGFYRERQLDS